MRRELWGEREDCGQRSWIDREPGEDRLNLTINETAIKPSASRSSDEKTAKTPIEADDIVTVTTREGQLWLMTGSDFCDRVASGQNGARSGKADEPLGAIEFPRFWQQGTPSGSSRSGMQTTGAEVDKVTVSKVSVPVAETMRFCEQWEARALRQVHGNDLNNRNSIHKHGILAKCVLDDADRSEYPKLKLELASLADSKRPILVLIHGTASTTGDGFSALWTGPRRNTGSWWNPLSDSELEEGREAFDRLKLSYGEVYAFEHPTLTVSPIENALALVRQLPQGATLHLLTHSRGGLIGELLCRAMRVNEDSSPANPKFDATDEKLVADSVPSNWEKREEERFQLVNALRQLNAELAQKQLKIERFVRVACPALGTSLITERPEKWLSAQGGALKKMADSAEWLASSFDEFMGFAKGLLSVFIKQPKDPKTSLSDAVKVFRSRLFLRGLAAMSPDSGVVRMINRTDLLLDADLTVVAGDIEGADALLASLAESQLDAMFRGQHDLVVNTGAMAGGAERLMRPSVLSTTGTHGARGADSKVARHRGWLLFEQGAAVNHFNYFRNKTSVPKILARLLQRAVEPEKQGFEPIEKEHIKEPTRSGQPPTLSLRERLPVDDVATGKRPIVVVLPGLMGSELSQDGQTIWIDLQRLTNGDFKKLAIDAHNVRANKLLDAPYADLCEFLSRTFDVIRFPYDWRCSVEVSAAKLAERLKPVLDVAKENHQPVSFVAHSMGSMVLAALIAFQQGTWRRIREHKEARAVLLGAPLEGSWSIVQLLRGHSDLLGQLALIELNGDLNNLLEIIRRFPGVLELLPNDNWDGARRFEHWGSGTPFDITVWEEWQRTLGAKFENGMQEGVEGRVPGVVLNGELLQQARQVAERLSKIKWEAEPVAFVSGQSDATLIGLRLQRDPNNQEIEVRQLLSAEGDGIVTWNQAALHQGNRWFMEVEHGSLTNYEPAFDAILDLLQSGRTTLLPRREAGLKRGPLQLPRDVPDRVASPIMFPTRETLSLVAVGGKPFQRRRRMATASQKIKVSVMHGDLTFARFPIAVGHYDGDPLLGPEKRLDEAFGGRLTERQAWGQYAGRIGTSEIALSNQPGHRPQGVIVVGLGRAGELTPYRLEQSFMRAVLKYATMAEELHDGRLNDPVTQRRQIRLSALLIGTAAEVMSVEDSLDAMLRGVQQAAKKLAEGQQRLSKSDQWPLAISEIEFVDVYEDMVGKADRALKELVNRQPFVGEFKAEPMQQRAGHQYREKFVDAPGWWHRLQITQGHDSELKFDMLTRRARTETQSLKTQTGVIDLLVTEATGTSAMQPEFCKTLFQMLLPNSFKEAAAWNDHLQLILDPKAAALPWELLWDRDRETPPVVDAGLLRQLKTERFRHNPVEISEKVACVIGDPATANGKPISGFPALEGAKQEAENVTETLRKNGFEVRDVVRGDLVECFNALHERGYRILHLAGHGVHEYLSKPRTRTIKEPHFSPEFVNCFCQCRDKFNEKPVSGMVLGRTGDRIAVLGAPDVGQMPTIPELVFINCCELGKTESSSEGADLQLTNPPAFAANIAVQFIEMGVRCVIAAGWQVDDAAARTFAEVFYDSFLKGETFGVSVQRARAETWRGHRSVNTWGAYQCYGDPGWRLISPEHRDEVTPPQRPDWNSPREAVVGLQNVTQRAKAATLVTSNSTRAELHRIYGCLTSKNSEWQDWMQRADVVGELGIAFSEVGEFERAASLLWECLQLNEGLPVTTLTQERLCDTLNRLSFQFKDDEARQKSLTQLPLELRPKCVAEVEFLLLEKSLERVLRLLLLSRSSELLQLLCSALRRRSVLNADRKSCLKWLKRAALASNAAMLEDDQSVQRNTRTTRRKWDSQSWPEYALICLRVLVAILEPKWDAPSKPRRKWNSPYIKFVESDRNVLTTDGLGTFESAIFNHGSQRERKSAMADDTEIEIEGDLSKPFDRQQVAKWCEDSEIAAEAYALECPSFWSSSWRGGCALLQLLLTVSEPQVETAQKDGQKNSQQKIAETADAQWQQEVHQIAQKARRGYEEAGRQGASARERNSVIQFVQFLARVLKSGVDQSSQSASAISFKRIAFVRLKLEELERQFREQWQT